MTSLLRVFICASIRFSQEAFSEDHTPPAYTCLGGTQQTHGAENRQFIYCTFTALLQILLPGLLLELALSKLLPQYLSTASNTYYRQCLPFHHDKKAHTINIFH